MSLRPGESYWVVIDEYGDIWQNQDELGISKSKEWIESLVQQVRLRPTRYASKLRLSQIRIIELKDA